MCGRGELNDDAIGKIDTVWTVLADTGRKEGGGTWINPQNRFDGLERKLLKRLVSHWSCLL